MKFRYLLFIIIFSTLTSLLNAQGSSCATMDGFCTSTGVTFSAGTNVADADITDPGNDYGCLLTSPNPGWYYLEVDNPGAIEITLTNSSVVDIDFALWGPFASVAQAQLLCNTYGPPIDCSFSIAATEIVNVPASTTGQVYVLLITNYSNLITNITATQTNGTGSTNCSVLCGTVGFDIVTPGPYTCDETQVDLLAWDDATAGGYVAPSFNFVVQTDIWSDLENSVSFYQNSVAPGNLVGTFGLGSVPASTTWTITGTYFQAGTTYIVEWCDDYPDGQFPYQIINNATGAVIASGTFDHDNTGLTCFTVSFSLGGYANYTGPGVTSFNDGSGTFDPSAVGPGTYAITYSWSNGANCTGTATQNITVTNPYNAGWNPPAPVCNNAAPINLNTLIAGSPGGVWSGTGVTGSTFNPSGLNGTYAITYTVGSSPLCQAVSTQNIQVNNPPLANFSYNGSTFCQSDPDPVLSIGPGATGGTFTAVPALGGLSTNGSISLAASAPGTYTITNTVIVGGCSATFSTPVTIVAAPNAEFVYDNSSYCQTGASPVLSHNSGGVNGVYTSSPAGLSLNSATGAINLAASTPGTYTVTNTVTAGTCTDVESVIVTIVTNPDATFSYNGTTFCQSGTDPVLTIGPGATAGTFTAVPPLGGLSTNGTISLAASATGTYTITNTVNIGGCIGTFSTPITIIASPNAEFVYDNTSYCQNGANPVLSHNAGGTNGVYTASPAGLSLNASTGDVNLVASTPGTYTVTNTVTVGACTDVETFTITVIATPNAAFNYNGVTFCLSGADPVLTIGPGATAGTFTAVPPLGGLSTNGTISLAASATGTYTITNTLNIGGCIGTFSTPVTIIASPNAEFVYDNTSYCQNGANPVLSHNAGGTNGVYTASPAGLSLNASTGDVNLVASTPGTYTVTNTVTVGNCTDAETFTITVIPTPNATFNYNGVTFCLSGADPVLTIGPGATAGTFSAVPPLTGLSTNGTISLAASTAGTYAITNTVNVSGCTNSYTTNITLTNAPNAEFIYDANTYCQVGANPVLSHNAGGTDGVYTSAPAGLSLNPSNGSVNLAASTPGTYTVTNTVTAPGCPTGTHQFTLTIVANPNAEFSYTSAAVCQNSGTLTPLHTGGGVNGVYTVISGNGLIINASTGEITPASSLPGTYTIQNTVSGGGVCPDDVQTFVISITSPGNADFSYGNSTFCISGSNPVPGHPNGGTDGVYTASPAGVSINSITGIINLAASTAGTYTITNTVPGNGPCPAVSFTQIITITANPNAEFSYSSATFCQNAANPTPLHLNGGSNGTYTSSPAGLSLNATTGQINLTASTPGIYTVTNSIPASGGCLASVFTQSVTVIPSPDASFSYGTTAFCQTNGNNPFPGHPNGGIDGTYSASPAGLSINPATGEINLSASTPGTYTVTNTVPGGAGCPASSATQLITVTPPLNAEFTYGTNSFCQSSGLNPTVSHPNGGTDGIYAYTIVTGTGPLSLNSSTGEINLAASAPGVYQITNTIAASGGCAAETYTQVIVITAGPDAAFTYDASSYCAGGNNPVLAFAPGAIAGFFSYTSSTGGILSLDPATGYINLGASAPGTYTITNTIAASGGCAATSASQTLTITTAPDAEFSYDATTYCINAANPVLSHTTGSDGVYSYIVLSGGPNLILDPNTGAINIAGSNFGTYQITNTIPAGGGCPASTYTDVIVIQAAPDAEFSYDDILYCGTSQIPVVMHNSGVNGTYSYTVLSGGPTLLLNPSTGSIDLTLSNPGTYQITNTVSGNGCPSDVHSVNLTYANPPTASISPGGIIDICTFGDVDLTGNGGSAYLWLNYNSSIGIVTNTFTATAPGNYSVVAYSVEGCPDTSSVTVITSNNFPSADLLSGPMTLCPGQAVTILSQGSGNLYEWLNNGVAIPGENGNSLTVQNAGIYSFVSSNFCGADTTSVVITESAGPDADFYYEPSSPIYAGNSVSFTDQSISGALWGWDFGNGGNSTLQNPDYTYEAPGTYPVTVIVTDAFGCTDTAVKFLNVTVFTIDSLFIPNIFTPNADGTHDEFEINADGFSAYQLQLFNRWGTKVFETNDPSVKWNGYNMNGAICTEGIYFYVLKLKDSSGEELIRDGNVTLMR
ncbi:MAG: gliding motility-associated C-terminal domain-containing protein [Bacteroidia bacterium]|nr:gliding motility-associated C-terminal domain-containing protein [Bacteroidia bacterium]